MNVNGRDSKGPINATSAEEASVRTGPAPPCSLLVTPVGTRGDPASWVGLAIAHRKPVCIDAGRGQGDGAGVRHALPQTHETEARKLDRLVFGVVPGGGAERWWCSLRDPD